MKILHTEASSGWGGQEIRVLAEARGFIDRGHDVRLAAPPGSRIFEEAPRCGVPAHALPIGAKRLPGLLAMRRLVRAVPFDVINTHSSTDSWLSALAVRGLAAPPAIVRTRHISAPIANGAATRWLYTRATAAIVTTGEALRRQLVEQNHYPANRVVSVPTGIDTTRFVPGDRAARRRELGLPEAPVIIGIVATLRSWKGHRHLLEALRRLDRADVLLVIVGAGPQRAALETQVADLGIGDRVRMVGHHDDVLPWHQALDIFALPSYANEGVPQALVQAMLCGLPCVTTAVGAIPEVTGEGEFAIVVREHDPSALAQGLRALVDDPALRHRLGAAGRAHCAQAFGYTHMLDRMEAVFAEAIARNRRA